MFYDSYVFGVFDVGHPMNKKHLLSSNDRVTHPISSTNDWWNSRNTIDVC
jgi:hypothetical protein